MNSSAEQRVFDGKTIDEIGSISGLAPPQLASLMAQLEAIGQHFRKIILTAPTNMTAGPPDKSSAARQKWLRSEILRPVSVLLSSIDQPAMLESWPDHIPTELDKPELSQLRTLLMKLHGYAEDLRDSVATRSADGSTLNAELRTDLVSRVAAACRDAGLPMSRHRIRKVGYKLSGSRIVEHACHTICGATFSIDQHLRDFLKLHQE